MRFGHLVAVSALATLGTFTTGCVFHAQAGAGTSAGSSGGGSQMPQSSWQNPSTPAPARAPMPATAGTPRPVVAKPRPAWGRPGRILPTGAVPTVTQPTPFGNDALNQLFVGTVYFVPETTERFPDVSGLKARGMVGANELNVPTRNFDTGFPGIECDPPSADCKRNEWFAIRYVGKFMVQNPAEYRFTLSSDDGSLLYIDGKLVVDNDGRHLPKEKDGRIALTAGEHSIQVDYFQALRWTVNLQLFVEGPNKANRIFTSPL